METVVGYVLAEVNKVGKMSQTKEKLIPQAFKKKISALSSLYFLFSNLCARILPRLCLFVFFSF